jgi:hypothetical protein
MERQGRTEDVLVLPVCVSYHYREADWVGVGRLLGKIERECGLPPLPTTSGEKPYARVMRVVRILVVTAEAHYARTRAADPGSDGDDRVEALQRRLEAIVEAALVVAERHFKVKPHGDWVQRVMTIRYAGLGWIHREDLGDAEALPPLVRALAGRLAAEAWLCLRHLELADVLEYVRIDYLSPDSSVDRYVESVTTLWDVVNRLEGGNISGRGTPFGRSARIDIAEPLPVARFLETYRGNRRRGVAEMTAEILGVFRRMAEHGTGPEAGGRAGGAAPEGA